MCRCVIRWESNSSLPPAWAEWVFVLLSRFGPSAAKKLCRAWDTKKLAALTQFRDEHLTLFNFTLCSFSSLCAVFPSVYPCSGFWNSGSGSIPLTLWSKSSSLRSSSSFFLPRGTGVKITPVYWLKYWLYKARMSTYLFPEEVPFPVTVESPVIQLVCLTVLFV